MRQSVRNTLLLLALGATGAVGVISSNQRQVGGFVAQLPPQAPGAPQSQAAGHRHLQVKGGVPITSRLEPGDKVVEMISTNGPLLMSLDGGNLEDTMANYLKHKPAVAVITVTKKESRFTSLTGRHFAALYSSEDWLQSTLTAEVQSVLKDSTGRLVPGASVEIEELGGDMVLPDGRRIIARYHDTRATRVGGTYLAMLGLDEDGRLMFDRELSVEYVKGQIKNMHLNRAGEGLEQRTPAWVVEQAERRRNQ